MWVLCRLIFKTTQLAEEILLLTTIALYLLTLITINRLYSNSRMEEEPPSVALEQLWQINLRSMVLKIQPLSISSCLKNRPTRRHYLHQKLRTCRRWVSELHQENLLRIRQRERFRHLWTQKETSTIYSRWMLIYIKAWWRRVKMLVEQLWRNFIVFIPDMYWRQLRT